MSTFETINIFAYNNRLEADSCTCMFMCMCEKARYCGNELNLYFNYLYYILCQVCVFIMDGVSRCHLVYSNCLGIFYFFSEKPVFAMFDSANYFAFSKLILWLNLCHVLYKWICSFFYFIVFLWHFRPILIYLLSKPLDCLE